MNDHIMLALEANLILLAACDPWRPAQVAIAEECKSNIKQLFLEVERCARKV